jgi:hypothetical protein
MVGSQDAVPIEERWQFHNFPSNRGRRTTVQIVSSERSSFHFDCGEECGIGTKGIALGERAGGDAFVLARIAGYSSIMVTQRYIHPQVGAINRVFAAAHSEVGTKLDTRKGTLKLVRSKTLARK